MTDEAEKRSTRTILIASGKGGVGKSTAAMFLAEALARLDRKVLLIDADAGLGCLDRILLGERAEAGWYEAASEFVAWADAVRATAGGVDLLAAPETAPDPGDAELIGRCVEHFKGAYDLILVDAPAGVDSTLTGLAKVSDRGIVGATADAVSVRGATAAAEALIRAGMAPDDIRLLINRFVKKQALRAKLLDIDGVIDRTGVMLLGILPEDERIPTSSVTGKLPKAKSAFLLACGRVARRICGEARPLSFRKMK